MSTKIIPTDKNGNVYYGPTTFADAESRIHDLDLDPAQVANDMEQAGFRRIAARIRKEWEI